MPARHAAKHDSFVLDRNVAVNTLAKECASFQHSKLASFYSPAAAGRSGRLHITLLYSCFGKPLMDANAGCRSSLSSLFSVLNTHHSLVLSPITIADTQPTFALAVPQQSWLNPGVRFPIPLHHYHYYVNATFHDHDYCFLFFQAIP